jgi:hydroxyacylglutathione hydrolase
MQAGGKRAARSQIGFSDRAYICQPDNSFGYEIMNHVSILRAWEDNYIHLFQYDRNSALVVDPADDKVVLRALQSAGLDLTHILVTHHHWDHVAGIKTLKDQTGCEIVGPDQKRIPQISHLIRQGDRLAVGSTHIDVIATPGHTRTSACYYCPPSRDDPDGRLWTGDTLFRGGCGRLFECSAQVMWQSLQKICALPDTTLIYGGHDYAKENYRFGLSIEPKNQEIKQCLSVITSPDFPSKEPPPTTLAQEKQTNVFLRSARPGIKATLGEAQSEAAVVFAELRARKDIF